MNNLPLKPLKWHEQQGRFFTKSPITEYEIVNSGDKHKVYYTKRHDNYTREATGFATIDEAKAWAWNHYNEKMQPYVKPDSITDIRNWFKAAKPDPTNTDVIAQVACHLEEVDEFIDSMDIHPDPELLEEVRRNCKEIRNKGYSDKSIENSDHLDIARRTLDQICYRHECRHQIFGTKKRPPN